VISRKKLGLSVTGEDALTWLERRMHTAQWAASGGDNPVIDSLRRLLETSSKRKLRKRRTPAES
jgi:hypothetical protein